jgi:hypothetical protein
MMGSSAAGAKVDTKAVKSTAQETWKARMCGRAQEQTCKCSALFSMSTAAASLALPWPSLLARRPPQQVAARGRAAGCAAGAGVLAAGGSEAWASITLATRRSQSSAARRAARRAAQSPAQGLAWAASPSRPGTTGPSRIGSQQDRARIWMLERRACTSSSGIVASIGNAQLGPLPTSRVLPPQRFSCKHPCGVAAWRVIFV